jgi:predicted 2-oxoglutarate/Fe(II)-dependent dioxygenase YbiX
VFIRNQRYSSTMSNERARWAQIWTLPEAVSAEVCARWVTRAEEGFWNRDATQENKAPTRSSTKAKVGIDAVFPKVEAVVPHRIFNLSLSRIPRERMIFIRYDVGDRFGVHTDAPYIPDARSKSMYTLMIYLNENFEGGATGFPGLRRVVQPRTGMALIFPHRVQHEGLPVTNGTKYALHTFVVYESMPTARPAL